MMKIVLSLALVGLGLAAGAFAPGLTDLIRSVAGLASPASGQASNDHGHGHAHKEGERESPEGHIAMAPDQIEAAKIVIEPAGPGTLARRLTVPGVVTPDSDRVARIAAKVTGTVAELRKRLGDPVDKGEVVAILDSREVADAKSEYFAARVNLDLQRTLFEREQRLWDSRVSAENQFLRARNTFTETELRAELASQKLQALGLSEREVAELKRSGSARGGSSEGSASAVGLQRYALRSPIAGRVIERRVDLGAPVGGDNQEKELYVVADLSSVWIELSVPTGDLSAIREGQEVAITSGSEPASKGRIVFVSPVLNQDTRSARVIASVENKDLTWRPGSYVTARVVVAEEPVELRLPRTALQTIAGEQVIFVRNDAGFEKREVALGRTDETSVEIVFGLDPGERVAVSNSFLLKAELGKAEAEHAH